MNPDFVLVLTRSTGRDRGPHLITKSDSFALEELFQRVVPEAFHHHLIYHQVFSKDIEFLEALIQHSNEWAYL